MSEYGFFHESSLFSPEKSPLYLLGVDGRALWVQDWCGHHTGRPGRGIWGGSSGIMCTSPNPSHILSTLQSAWCSGFCNISGAFFPPQRLKVWSLRRRSTGENQPRGMWQVSPCSLNTEASLVFIFSCLMLGFKSLVSTLLGKRFHLPQKLYFFHKIIWSAFWGKTLLKAL